MAPESECNIECTNDSNKKCGAGWRNSVYALAEAIDKKTEYESVVGETYVGCYKDGNVRAMPNLLHAGYCNYRRCFMLAKSKGYRYAGL